MCAHTSGDPMNVWARSRGSSHLEREQDAPDKACSAFPTFQFQRSTQTPDLDPILRFVAGNERRPHYPGPTVPSGGQRCGERFRLILCSLRAFAHSVQSWLQAARCFERSLPASTYSVRLLLQVAHCFAADDRC